MMTDIEKARQLSSLVQKFELMRDVGELLFEMGEDKKVEVLNCKQEVRWEMIKSTCQLLQLPLPN
ncbi:hypothetical protein U8V72_14300 [Priestia filamentosa]|uniref:hypothetical protein n=1 Tax=Priestia filamentosa TaxID=1402861 RepID=UPI0005891330